MSSSGGFFPLMTLVVVGAIVGDIWTHSTGTTAAGNAATGFLTAALKGASGGG